LSGIHANVPERDYGCFCKGISAMLYYPKDIVGLRKAAKQCRELAATAEDGFVSLSYAQLADEIDAMIAIRETVGTDSIARSVHMGDHFHLAA
jgi:hypothetical protein